jgi:deoxyribose-phosphate aldolase
MATPTLSSHDAARIALACLDLTSLRGDEDAAAIEALADKAAHPAGSPAALCVYPVQVRRARTALDARGLAAVRVATVVGFPLGDASPTALEREIGAVLPEGADEIDMVLPWQALLAAARGGMMSGGHAEPVPLHGLDHDSAVAACRAAVAAARKACGSVPLKVIIESGELAVPALVAQATQIAIDEGADFVKTSTGKARVHATPSAVATMLDVIHRSGRQTGLKVAGGVQTVADVERYLGLAMPVFGTAGLVPARLRFGASSLWPALIEHLQGRAAGTASDPSAAGY